MIFLHGLGDTGWALQYLFRFYGTVITSIFKYSVVYLYKSIFSVAFSYWNAWIILIQLLLTQSELLCGCKILIYWQISDSCQPCWSVTAASQLKFIMPQKWTIFTNFIHSSQSCSHYTHLHLRVRTAEQPRSRKNTDNLWDNCYRQCDQNALLKDVETTQIQTSSLVTEIYSWIKYLMKGFGQFVQHIFAAVLTLQGSTQNSNVTLILCCFVFWALPEMVYILLQHSKMVEAGQEKFIC